MQALHVRLYEALLICLKDDMLRTSGSNGAKWPLRLGLFHHVEKTCELTEGGKACLSKMARTTPLPTSCHQFAPWQIKFAIIHIALHDQNRQHPPRSEPCGWEHSAKTGGIEFWLQILPTMTGAKILGWPGIISAILLLPWRRLLWHRVITTYDPLWLLTRGWLLPCTSWPSAENTTLWRTSLVSTYQQ